MLKLLKRSDIEAHYGEICSLFGYCKRASSGDDVTDDFCRKKIDELLSYLDDGRAHFFASIEDCRINGFLWACRIMRESGERFHILYFAVSEESQGQGIGEGLLLAAEGEALKLGVKRTELNVHMHNTAAMRFYSRRGYRTESSSGADRIMLIKDLF